MNLFRIAARVAARRAGDAGYPAGYDAAPADREADAGPEYSLYSLIGKKLVVEKENHLGLRPGTVYEAGESPSGGNSLSLTARGEEPQVWDGQQLLDLLDDGTLEAVESPEDLPPGVGR